MYITYGKVFGGTPNIFMLWLFPEKGSISERTVNRALIVNNSIKFCINKKKNNNNYHFHHVPKLSIGFNCLFFFFPHLHSGSIMWRIASWSAPTFRMSSSVMWPDRLCSKRNTPRLDWWEISFFWNNCNF